MIKDIREIPWLVLFSIALVVSLVMVIVGSVGYSADAETKPTIKELPKELRDRIVREYDNIVVVETGWLKVDGVWMIDDFTQHRYKLCDIVIHDHWGIDLDGNNFAIFAKPGHHGVC